MLRPVSRRYCLAGRRQLRATSALPRRPSSAPLTPRRRRRREQDTKMKLKQLEGLLGGLTQFPEPKVELEQYPTGPHIASRMLYTAENSFDDIAGKVVADFGCGCGTLAVASALLDAEQVIGVDIDSQSLELAQENADDLELDIDLIWSDIKQLNLKGVAPLQLISCPSLLLNKLQFCLSCVTPTARCSLLATGDDELVEAAFISFLSFLVTLSISKEEGTMEAGRVPPMLVQIQGQGRGGGEESRVETPAVASMASDRARRAAARGLVYRYRGREKLHHVASQAVYSLHKTSTREHIKKAALRDYNAASAEVLCELRYDLPQSYKFHKKREVDIAVDLWRFVPKAQPSS
ncbi:hypothetical protein PR202_ga18033 [Eleusine coracana subsp. coracana]|uniref:Methyltransferase small domain-containing protein n=1 Tax=Eleusine coracana subsp. coracana TaxID=191504 RepID=A0AAV5CSC7_ELECO|nr:hypothetical protein PR202_ga18033 [Eleusine coracana subsp. coracana]